MNTTSSSTLLGIIIIFVGAALAFFGLFNRIDLEIKEAGGEIVVYRNVKGDYKQVRTLMNELYHELRIEFEIKTNLGYAKYLSSPIGLNSDEVYAEVGVVLKKEHFDEIPELEKDFLVKKIELKEYIVTEFPFRGKTSNFFVLKKVYPALDKFAGEKGFFVGSPVIEIEDIVGSRITFMKEIE